MLVIVRENTGDVNKIQRTHDMGIEVIGNGHVNQHVEL